MKELKVVLSDDEIRKLERTSKAIGLPAEEIVRKSLAEYLEKLKVESEFDPVGFGMWRSRTEMRDSTKWVQELRKHREIYRRERGG